MESIGKTLKAAREHKQMEIGDVVAATLMQPHVISAIENDDFAAMPAPVYARGFLRLYAECVGLDPVPIVDAYNNHGKLTISARRNLPAEKIPKPRQAPHSPTLPQAEERKPCKVRQEKKTRAIRFNFPKLPDFKEQIKAITDAAQRLRGALSKLRASAISNARLTRLSTVRIGASTHNRIRQIGKLRHRFSMPLPRISADGLIIIFRAALALLFIILAIYGVLWYTDFSRPRIFNSRRIQEPPVPYVAFRP